VFSRRVGHVKRKNIGYNGGEGIHFNFNTHDHDPTPTALSVKKMRIILNFEEKLFIVLLYFGISTRVTSRINEQ
jgi:hypothetical protein